MAKIDKMLQMMQDRGVERAVLVGDKPFQIYSAGGVIEGSVTPAAQLLELLEEIVPPAFLPQLRGGGSFHFRHVSIFGDFDCGVENFASALQVSIAVAKSQKPLAAPTAALFPNAPLSPSAASPSAARPPIAAPVPTIAPAAANFSAMKRELYIHRGGQNIGPMTPERAETGARSGEYSRRDLAIAPHLQDWAPLQNVLDAFGIAPGFSSPAPPVVTPATAASVAATPIVSAPFGSSIAAPATPQSAVAALIRSFLNEEQDPGAVTRVVERLQQLCTPEETILYVAVQKKPVVTVAPVSVALTSRRVLIFRPKALGLGLTFKDFPWRTVVNIHISEAVLGATFTVRLSNNSSALVDSLPKAQARKLYQFGQQMEEHMYSHRRDLMLEEKRAGAGGVSVSVNQTPPAAAPAATPNAPVSAPQNGVEDPLTRLQKLKILLDQGLISQQDYDAKKAEIMAQF